MDGFRVDTHAHVPPSVQIVEAVLDAIAAGRIDAGERLPSVRALAVDVLVNPNTVSRAYGELERLAVVEGRNGSGVFVAADGPRRARALRRDATRSAFQVAVREALRAGHAPDELWQWLETVTGDLREVAR